MECPYRRDDKCNRGCRGFHCRHREENRPTDVAGPAHLAPQPAPGLAFDEHGVLRPMVHALAAIDAALGLPADGCNSTQQTLAAIKKLKDGRDAFQESLYAELDTNFRLRDLGGARPDESMTPFLERVIAERDTLRGALLVLANAADGMCVAHFDSDDLPPAVQATQDATNAARVALGPNVRANLPP
jgi:hypothetical protein